MKAMLYDWVEDPDVIESLLSDDLWVMEQKMDGTRGLAAIDGQNEPRMMHRGGGPLKHTAATQYLDHIWHGIASLGEQFTPSCRVVLDGEIMIDSGEYRVFDVPYLSLHGRDVVTSQTPFQMRREILEWLMSQTGPNVSAVRQVRGQRRKCEMLAACREQGVEGVMFKHRESPYLPGQRSNQGLKVKFVKTADVVVIDSSRSRNEAGRETGSFSLAVVPPPEWEMTQQQQQSVMLLAPGVPPLLPIGACSAIGKPHVEVGDVIEVAYLYWTGTTLYQPRMIKVRRDKNPRTCEYSQFLSYSRKAVI